MSIIDITNTARTYREIQAEIKALEEQADTLKQQMIREMDSRQVDKLAAGEFEIRYTLTESNRLDTTRFKANRLYHRRLHPHAEQCPDIHCFQRFPQRVHHTGRDFRAAAYYAPGTVDYALRYIKYRHYDIKRI